MALRIAATICLAVALVAVLAAALAAVLALLPLPARASTTGASVSAGGEGWLPLVVTRDASGRLFLWGESGTLAPGWPVAASGAWPIGTPRLQDLDGDGQPEVVCLLKSWDGGKAVRVWRLDGRPLHGWESVACPPDMADTPALGDVEHTGVPDWAWPTEGGAVGLAPAGDPGHQRPGFPKPVAAGRLRLRLADVNGDGVPEVLGGVDEGATGRWFWLYLWGGPAEMHQELTPAPVTAAPVLASPSHAGAMRALVALRGGLGCWDSDGAGGFRASPGWPALDSNSPEDAPVALPDTARRVLARGRDGRLAAYACAGQPVRRWADGVRLGASVSWADLPADVGHGGWVGHSGGTDLAFQSETGSDSTGRPRLFTRELGDRHHSANPYAPAGLLPPTVFRIWLNGMPARTGGETTLLRTREVEVRGTLDSPSLAGDPELELEVCRGSAAVGRVAARGILTLRLTLDAGGYSALARAGRDTLACVRFEVEPPLELQDLYNYPNPMRTATDFLFTLSRPARVDLDVYTVAGRRVRSLGGDFAAGPQRLGWDGRDAAGHAAANGVYLYRVQARAGTERVEKVGKLIRLD